MDTESVIVVFNGFLNLTGKEKLALVESVNEYFDSNDREPIRSGNDARMAAITFGEERRCPCCGR